ncbi:Two component regulator three Y domain protein [Aequorivita sp. SDUM287046]|uniref:Two component regulator three Y domain protein n=1 Tax=Aequorivita aurantiaca TaxID=3053356 RepID=A0ABT8DH57_9FLAO|nr:leucine-rich repeat domain-containing protein [Aequorivita aurantiaca]MDN3724049.1 Two component regulator three Y domain protein [Aequorivita aurantiaca]
MKNAVLTCIGLFFASAALAQVSSQEKEILLDFYSATNGNNWTKTWNLQEPVTQWHGITVENNTVTGINMLFNNLTGTLPGSLGQLKNLKKLELSFNQLSGSIPPALGNLENLEILALNATDIQGIIPAELGKLSNLKQLHLSSNKLYGSVPESLGNLKKIEVFNVFDNNLSGELPTHLAKCPNLKELMVAENNFINPNDFSLVLLANSGAKMDLGSGNPHIIAIERDESDD